MAIADFHDTALSPQRKNQYVQSAKDDTAVGSTGILEVESV